MDTPMRMPTPFYNRVNLILIPGTIESWGQRVMVIYSMGNFMIEDRSFYFGMSVIRFHQISTACLPFHDGAPLGHGKELNSERALDGCSFSQAQTTLSRAFFLCVCCHLSGGLVLEHRAQTCGLLPLVLWSLTLWPWALHVEPLSVCWDGRAVVAVMCGLRSSTVFCWVSVCLSFIP